METAPSDSPRDGVKPGADPAADAAAAQPEPPVTQPEIQLAQAEPPPAPAPETGRTAAAGSAENGESVERGSVLQEFLADGPPQVEADGEQAGGERRPVQMQQDEEQPQETEAPGEAPPVETAADAEVPQTSGTSFYEDDLGGLRDTLPDVADDPTVPQNADPLLVEQISDPLVLASAAVATGGATLDVVVPPPAPVPDEPINNPDPLTERELAEGDAGGANGSSGGDDEAVFSFSLTADEGDNVVTDFDAASDTLQITDVIDLNADSAIDFADLDAGGSTVSGTAGSVDIALAGGTTIVLQGVDGSGLDSFEDLNGSINLDVVA